MNETNEMGPMNELFQLRNGSWINLLSVTVISARDQDHDDLSSSSVTVQMTSPGNYSGCAMIIPFDTYTEACEYRDELAHKVNDLRTEYRFHPSNYGRTAECQGGVR